MLALFYLSSVFYFRARLKNKANREAELKKDLAPMISKFLFYTEEDPLEARREYVQLKIEIRQLLKNGLTRTVLSEVLRDLKKDVSGSARNELLSLYSDLGLQEDAIQRLKSRRWQVLSKAILELTEMEVRGAYGLIKKFVNHRSSIVRKQAQLATVSLKNEGITYFLDSNRYQISEWQQLKLLDVISSALFKLRDMHSIRLYGGIYNSITESEKEAIEVLVPLRIYGNVPKSRTSQNTPSL